MFKIGEFSRLTQISIRMLRYYDEMGLLKPEYIDKSSGYRYYSVNQIPHLQKIALLRDLDFTVKEIKEGLLYGIVMRLLSFLMLKSNRLLIR